MKKLRNLLTCGLLILMSLCTLTHAQGLKKGDSFTDATVEGITMLFQVISTDDNTCRVIARMSGAVPSIDKTVTGSVTIPSTVQGYTVVEIGNGAFYRCAGITSVDIPTTVKTIGGSAFSACTALAAITGGANLEDAGADAFDKTPWYENQPEGVIYFGKMAYKYKGTIPNGTSLAIKDGPVSVAEGAFSGQKGLEEILIPNSVKKLGVGAFFGCTSIKNLVIPDGVETISRSCFNGCTGVETFYVGKNAKAEYYDYGDNGYWWPVGSDPTSIVVDEGNPYYDSRNNCNALIDKQYNGLLFGGSFSVIPEDVTWIGEQAFIGSNLYYLTIPNAVEEIGKRAFYNTKNLHSLIIGSGIEKIEPETFYGCDNLMGIRLQATVPPRLYYYDKNFWHSNRFMQDSIFNNAYLWVPQGCKRYYLDNDIYHYDWSRFRTILALREVQPHFPYEAFGERNEDGITLVYQFPYFGISSVYANNTPLSPIQQPRECYLIGAKGVVRGACNIPEKANGFSVTFIDNSAFDGQKELTSVTFPETVSSIGWSAFSGSGLQELTIPGWIKTIGNYAFSTKTLLNVTSLITEPYKISEEVFSKTTYANGVLYVPVGSKEKYRATEGWNKFQRILEIGETIRSGDVNGDDTVDVADIASVISVMAGSATSDPSVPSVPADVNGDGAVDVADIATIISIMAAQARQ